MGGFLTTMKRRLDGDLAATLAGRGRRASTRSDVASATIGAFATVVTLFSVSYLAMTVLEGQTVLGFAIAAKAEALLDAFIKIMAVMIGVVGVVVGFYFGRESGPR